jgi:hypothetical protein
VGSAAGAEDRRGELIVICTADGDPIHPQYGTLKHVLAELESEIRLGDPLNLTEYRVQLKWFRDKYWELANSPKKVPA